MKTERAGNYPLSFSFYYLLFISIKIYRITTSNTNIVQKLIWVIIIVLKYSFVKIF